MTKVSRRNKQRVRTHAEAAKPSHQPKDQPYVPQQVMDLAQRLADPGERPWFLTRDNKKGDYTTVEAAVHSGRPFVITVRDEFLVLDVDRLDQDRALEQIREVLEEWGVSPVIVASGQPGHLHLFAWVDSAPHRDHLRALARQASIDTRPSGAIRPPLSPHRLGPRSSLVCPETPLQALAALSTAPNTWPLLPEEPIEPSNEIQTVSVPMVKWSLNARVTRLLRYGATEPEDHFPSRSELEWAIFCEMARLGWEFQDAVQALSDPVNVAGERFLEKCEQWGRQRAEEMLERSFDKAVQHVLDHPRTDMAAVGERLLAHAQTWTGRTAGTDVVVYSTIVNHAVAAGTLNVNVSHRQLEAETGLGRGTVRRSMTRLRAGYLQLVKTGVGTIHASTYRLITEHLAETSMDPPLSHPNSLMLGGSIADPGHDVWTNRSGLGKYAYRLYLEILQRPNSWQGLTEVATFGVSRTVRKHLDALGRNSLAEESGGIWTGLMIPDEQANNLAAELGTEGRGQRIRDGHEREREAYTVLRTLLQGRRQNSSNDT